MDSGRDPFKCDRISIKNSISFLTNNVTCSFKSVAYVHAPDPPKIIILTFKENMTKLSEEIIQLESDLIVMDLKYVQTKGQWRLVICTNSVLMIYSEDGKRMLFHAKLDESSKLSEESFYFRGISSFQTGLKDLIAIGTSFGDIKFVENTKENQFVQITPFRIKDNPITQIATVQTDSCIVSADITGILYIISTEDLKALKIVKTIDTYSKKSPITSLAVFDMKAISTSNKTNYLCCGDYLGKIKIYNLNTFSLLAEISSHTRMVTCLDVKPSAFEIMSGSDDTFLNFWKLEEESDGEVKVQLKVSFRIADQMIVGAQYIKGKEECAIGVYDALELTLLKYDKL